MPALPSPALAQGEAGRGNKPPPQLVRHSNRNACAGTNQKDSQSSPLAPPLVRSAARSFHGFTVGALEWADLWQGLARASFPSGLSLLPLSYTQELKQPMLSLTHPPAPAASALGHSGDVYPSQPADTAPSSSLGPRLSPSLHSYPPSPPPACPHTPLDSQGSEQAERLKQAGAVFVQEAQLAQDTSLQESRPQARNIPGRLAGQLKDHQDPAPAAWG